MDFRETVAQDTPVRPPSWGRSPRRWIVAALVVVLLGAGFHVLRAWREVAFSVSIQRLRIAEAKRGDLIRDITASGRIMTANSPTVYAFAKGITQLQVVAGDAVKQGQVLGHIDSPELRSQAVQERSALASLEAEASGVELAAQIQEAAIQKRMAEAELQLRVAQKNSDRLKNAVRKGAYSLHELELVQTEQEQLRIDLRAAQRELNLVAKKRRLDRKNNRSRIEQQKAVVAEIERQIEALALRAPVDGQIGQLHIASGSHVLTGAPVVTVIDLTQFEVETMVPEAFARDLVIDSPAEITHQGQIYAGKVSAVSPEVVNAEVSARVRFTQKRPQKLRQNQRVTVRVILDTQKEVLMVEKGSFVESAGDSRVWVVLENVATPRSVRFGAQNLQYVEIRDGLAPGERVVVSGSELFGDYERVRISP